MFRLRLVPSRGVGKYASKDARASTSAHRLSLNLGDSCLLTGCATWFERFYKPASASYGSTEHLEKAYAPSETMPIVPVCGTLVSHNFIYATVDENGKPAVLGTLAPGQFTDILSESGASAASSEVTQLSIGPVVPPASPQLVWSADRTGDGKRLAQEGYVLIGTSSFLGWGVFFSRTGQGIAQATQEATAQGKRVGASVVLLSLPFTTVCAVKGGGPASNPLEARLLLAAWITQPHAAGTVFASYWAKASPAGT
jgi:hypothetical protein